MAISEAARSDLYTGLRDVIGPERAETLMSAIPLHDLDEVATKADLARLGAELRAEMAELRSELKTEMAELRADLKTEMAELRSETFSEIAALRQTVSHWMLTLLVTVVGAMATIGFLD